MLDLPESGRCVACECGPLGLSRGEEGDVLTELGRTATLNHAPGPGGLISSHQPGSLEVS